jgi:cysteine-rich repeat protein
MNARSIAVLGMLGSLVLGGLGAAGTAEAAAKPSLKCRNAIGASVRALVAAGLGQIDACHRARHRGKGGGGGDCNALDGANTSSGFGRAAARAKAVMSAACKAGDPVIDLYPGSDIPVVLLPAVEKLLERSAGELQGAPVFAGDKQAVKARGKCHAAVGTGRTTIVLDIVKKATKCQKRVDKKATSFGPIAEPCVIGAGVAGKVAGKVAKACGPIGGLEVGSCSALPSCLVDAATARGQALARLTYGGPTACGNGIEEIGEECDDGNTDSRDDCTARCTLPKCGDGIVSGAEECDEEVAGERAGSCVRCKRPLCGDGAVGAGEECDDGNDVDRDGCSGCAIDPLFCGTDGVIATVTVPSAGIPLAGIVLGVRYPTFASYPGSGATTDPSRLTDLTPPGAFLAPNDRDLDGDGTDDDLKVVYARSRTIPPGDFVRVRFDCAPGSAVRPADFACAFEDASDEFGNSYPPEQFRCSVSAVALPGGGTGTTSSTSTSTSTSSSTSSSVIGTTTSTTTSTTVPCTNTCGNDTVETCETCDDGNTSDEDTCPADCRVDACTPTATVRTVSVDVASGVPVAGFTIFLDYPEGRVSLPGSGGTLPAGTITNTPAGAFVQANDFDHALREVIVSGGVIPNGLAFRANFVACQGAPAPTAGDFACTVTDASDPFGNTVTGVTCSVTVP